jgi:hypothetical protein
MPDSIETRVADRVQIVDLLAFYCEQVDNYTIENLSTIFTPDCVFDAGPGHGGPRPGNDFGAVSARQARYRRTQHQLGQSRITFTGPDSAEGLTYVTAWHQYWDMSAMTARQRYVDQFRRRDGRWLIHRHRLEALGVEGSQEGGWNWADRRQPSGPGPQH